MFSANRIILAMTALIGAGAVAGLSTYYFQGRAIGLIEAASSNESSWVCVNGRGYLFAMREALADYLADTGPETARKLQLRANIFAGTIDSLHFGEFKSVIERSLEALRPELDGELGGPHHVDEQRRDEPALLGSALHSSHPRNATSATRFRRY